MKIRLGYVSISMNLQDSSTSKTTTLSTLSALDNDEKRIFKVRKLLDENLSNLFRILKYNKAQGFKVYRMSSKLVPFATHEIVDGWDYISDFNKKFKEIGNYIKRNDFRISAHPDHFTVVNTVNDEVFERSVQDLKYHNSVFEAMNLDSSYKFVIHIGGCYKDKFASIGRFYEGFNKLPKNIKNRITLENDDKTFNVNDVLSICKTLRIPMVLDVHHHFCNNDGLELKDILGEIFETWKGEVFPPKVHFSSPKSEKDFRSHADNINVDDFLKFVRVARPYFTDLDVMIEAKNKDVALLTLMDQLNGIKNIKVVSKSEFELIT